MSTQEQPSTFIDYYAIAEDFGKRRRAAEASTLSSNTQGLVATCGTEAEFIARQKASTDRNLGIARINFDVLARLLQLPEGHRILSVWASPKDLDVVEIRIEGPGMPTVRLGEVIPEVSLVFKT